MKIIPYGQHRFRIFVLPLRNMLHPNGIQRTGLDTVPASPYTYPEKSWVIQKRHLPPLGVLSQFGDALNEIILP
jgi:hypothetical protein